uniref:Aldo_ket_red domain-containing protein n=1 Tax=Panagrellus redivivus TaxID=6233 RepID=A0A7E4W2W5_PANRE
MKYKLLGRTNLLVSNIALGCGALGGLYGNLDELPISIVQTAIKNGINLIDTGYWYGQRRSEEILGKVLTRIPRKTYYISTKVGRYELDYARPFDFRADKILETLTKTLKRLKLTYVDICFLQIHDTDFEPNQSIILYETLPALQMAQQSGKIRYLGITGYCTRKIIEVISKSTVQIDIFMSYSRASLNDNSLGEHVPFFTNNKIAILNAAPFSQGLLTEKGPPLWHPASKHIVDVTREAVRYCQSKNICIEKLALHYGLNFPGIDTCVVGAESAAQVMINLHIAWLEGGLQPLEVRVLQRIMRRYFDKLENENWEGINVRAYWRRLQRLGLPTMSTNRFSSLESLSSTVTSISIASSKCY